MAGMAGIGKHLFDSRNESEHEQNMFWPLATNNKYICTETTNVKARKEVLKILVPWTKWGLL